MAKRSDSKYEANLCVKPPKISKLLFAQPFLCLKISHWKNILPKNLAFLGILFAKAVVKKQKIRFVNIVEIPRVELQNFWSWLNSQSTAQLSSGTGTPDPKVRTSLPSTGIEIFARVIESEEASVELWSFQSERCSFVIQYAKGVIKKFHGSRVVILKRASS